MRLAPRRCFIDQVSIRRESHYSAVANLLELAADSCPVVQRSVRLESDPDHPIVTQLRRAAHVEHEASLQESTSSPLAIFRAPMLESACHR